MTLRNAVWTGTAASAWPALSNTDTWAAGFWASPAVDASQLAAGPTAAVDGSNRGYITATHNLSPSIAATGTPVYTTNASTAGRYTFAVSAPPTTTSINTINLVFVTTTWTASHYHSVVSASCTGSWSGLTYDKVTDYVYNIGAVYYCLTVFRTTASSNTAGNIVVDVYDTSTGLIVGTQATGGTCQTFSVLGVDTSSNGANAIRAANTTTATNTTGQPAVTLPNNLSKYSSLPVMFCSHGTNNTMTADSSDSKLIASGSYGTPSNGVASVSRLVPSAVANVKTQRTMTANFATATTGWGAIGLEILDSSSSDSYTDRTRDYAYVRIANNSVQPAYQTSEVRAVMTSADGNYGPYHGLVGRYVTSGGTKYWIGTALRNDSAKAYGNAYIFAVVDNGTTSTITTVASTSGVANAMGTVTAQAIRVRVLASGDLWVSAKYWVDGASEPAWPTASTDASVYSGAPVYAVVNGVYSTSDALRNATSGQTGLYYLFPAATGTGLSSSAWYGPTDGVNTATWTSWSNDAWVESGTSTLTGTGTLTTDALRIAIGSATLTGALGTLTGTAYAIASATGTMSGTGTMTSAAIRTTIGTATLTGTGALTASGIGLAYGSAALTGTGALVAAGTRFMTALATLTGSGSLTATGEKYVVGGYVSSAIVALAQLTTANGNAPGSIAQTAAHAGGAVSSTHALRP